MILIKTQKDALLLPLQSVSGIVERRHTLPILSNVLLEKRGEQLTLLATDIEIQITTSTHSTGNGDGAITVGAKKLQEILRSLPEDAQITLVLEENKRLQVSAGKSRFSLQTLPADDFPRMTLAEGESCHLQVSQKIFRELLKKTQFSMAMQDVRYYLNGLLLMTDGKALRAVATDGHRLSYACVSTTMELPHQEMILPRKTIIELNRLLADSDDLIDITLAPNQARFAFGSVVLISKLIDGKFPSYERVVPTDLKNHLTVGRQLLIQSMNRVAILTNEKLRGVRLVLNKGLLKLISANTEQEEAHEEMEVSYDGDPLDVGFNVSYLLDVLNNLDVETVCWSFNDANTSALVTVPGDDNFKYVVMPLRI